MDGIEEGILSWQYLIDHTELCVILTVKATKGHDIKIICDHKNFFHSSCIRQAPRVKEMFDSGVAFVTVKPPVGGFASMHTKAWIFDEKTLVSGSANSTHNSMENNHEHIFRITNPAVVQQAMCDHQTLWDSGKPVTQEEINKMMQKYGERVSKKADAERSSRSQSASVDDED